RSAAAPSAGRGLPKSVGISSSQSLRSNRVVPNVYCQTAYTLLAMRLCLGSGRRAPSARTSGAEVSALLTRSDYGRSYRFYSYVERKTYRQRVEGEKYWRRVLAQARTPLASLRSITSTPVAGVGVRVALAERVGVFRGKWTR